MEYEERELKLYSILNAKTYLEFQGKRYYTTINTVEDKHRASILYHDIINDLKYETIMSWVQAQKMTEKLGLWTTENESGLESLNKMLDDLKLQLYLHHYIPDRVEAFTKQIEKVRSGIEKSTNNKYVLYHATKEYYTSNIKRQYLLALSIRDENDQPVYTHENFWVSDATILNVFENRSLTNFMTITEIRELARSDPWRSMWGPSKANALSGPSTSWTEEQKVLVSYSRMYDNVYESMECPSDMVIENDDMLDGWFISQRKEREKARNEKAADKLFKGGEGHQELFLMAGSQEHAQNIYNMNDEQSRNTIKSREKQIKEKGEVKHQNLQDVQMDMRMQATQETMQKMRNR